jgi:tRNA(His) guanylyltransferase
MTDDLGDRMKGYEVLESGRRLQPIIPIVARIDGRAFHTFTHGLERPFDPRLAMLMLEVTRRLVGATCANIGYTQSDEISLLFHQNDPKSQVFFDRKVLKMTSILASMATLYFNREVKKYLGYTYADKEPMFDARVWNIPSTSEVINYFIWREQDAVRNSIQAAAHHYYSATELHGKSSIQMLEMLSLKGVSFDKYPALFKRGMWVQRKKVLRSFDPVLDKDLPPLHDARRNPEAKYERHEIRRVKAPLLSQIMGKFEFLFYGGEPNPYPGKEQI